MTKSLCPILSNELEKIDCTLSIEEETRLITLAKQGNVKARNKLLETQLRQIVAIARSYANPSNSVTELVSDGSIGFDHAIDKFDLNAGVRFVTYYRFWVRDSINRAVHDNHTIRPPMNIAKTNSKTEEELAKMKSNKRKVEDKVHIGFSINTPVGDDSNATYEDTLRGKDCVETNVTNNLTIESILKCIDRNSKEWKYLKYHHIDGMGLDEIGEIFKVSKQAVSANMQKTIKRIRARIK